MADETERETQLKQLEHLKAMGEKAYDDMYEARSPLGCYCDLKDYFTDAIAAAERAGLPTEAKRLRDRLMSCISIYRSQFGNF